MNEEIWIPIVAMLSFFAIVFVWVFFRYKTRLDRQQTFRLALEKGTELSPEFMKQLADPEPPKDRDLRRGLVWLAIGVATALFGIILPEEDATGPLVGIAMFPTLVGAAYLAMYRYGVRKG